MKRFALNCRPAIEQAPLQTYCSALIFAPDKSLVRKRFEDEIPKWMKRFPKAQEDWSASLQTLEGHTASVSSVAFSRDGALLASGSADNTVRLWDAATGAAKHTLKGHTYSVSSVAFSPDGTLLASGSGDKTVRLWDAATGAAKPTLEGHTYWVSSVAFSPDGTLLASGSDDNTVRLWDAATGAMLQRITVAFYVKVISFTSDGSFIETNHGLLRVEGLQGRDPLGVVPQPQPRIFLDGNWVLRDSKRLLWLPADYRGWSRSAVRGGIIVLGHSDGRVTFMEIGWVG